MATTAEGVETREQLDLLVSAGCTEVQGYLFSPAVPGGEVAGVLRHDRRDAAAASRKSAFLSRSNSACSRNRARTARDIVLTFAMSCGQPVRCCNRGNSTHGCDKTRMCRSPGCASRSKR